MPYFIDMIAAGLRESDETLALTLDQAISDRNFYYAPTRAGAKAEEHPSVTGPLSEEELPASTGIAIVAHTDREGSSINRRLLVAWVYAGDRLRLYLSEIVLNRPAPSESYVVRLGRPREEELSVSNGVFLPFRERERWAYRTLIAVCRAIPVVMTKDEVSDSTSTRPTEESEIKRRGAEDGVRIAYAFRNVGSRGTKREPAAVQRSSHWGVRGHWRNQWYPSLEDHKRIWIDEHTAGAINAPLSRRDLVYVISPR